MLFMSPDEPPTAADAYDKLSQTDETREDDPYCADLEFPAMRELVPDVAGKRVLDAGCGAGRYAEWLIEKGRTLSLLTRAKRWSNRRDNELAVEQTCTEPTLERSSNSRGW
ncbi:MAG: SAM-dependent methyltransferase [Natrialbaceae archaeon]|jgi:SAM-dependent methyltransferase